MGKQNNRKKQKGATRKNEYARNRMQVRQSFQTPVVTQPLFIFAALIIILGVCFYSQLLHFDFFNVNNLGGDSEQLNDQLLSPSNAVLESLSTVPVCSANISHRVTYEELEHIKIWTIQSFLPHDKAELLHSLINSEPLPEEGGDGKSWVYTANQISKNGRGTNQKVRANIDIAKRRRMAQWARELGTFAYSKNELNATSFPYKIIHDFLWSSQTMNCLSNLTGISLVEVTDMFVSMYIKGDFLTLHQDFNLGTYAFILQLSKDWKRDFGGSLDFSCSKDRYNPRKCKSLVPTFNTLTLFKTRPDLVDHWVDEVTVPSHVNRRYAVTGWIASSDDTGFDKHTDMMKEQKGSY